jgi:serine/threonine-protein kinase
VADSTASGGHDETPRWEQLSMLFDRAQAYPAARVNEFIDKACAGDADLARELRSLLEAGRDEHGPLESIADALHSEPLPAPDVVDTSVHIGPYSLVRELGRGGMGVVFLARRADGQYTRDVALKLAQNPMFDAGFRERFFAERDILARLSHPNIAALYDGGVTEEGHPYFTMEYVDGRPVDAYCDEEKLDVASRVRLFLQICGASAAAHRSLVVHRDLKPSNVLVNANGSVKLLDFGIAKLLDQQRPGGETQAAIRMFTRDYASPEQVRGGAVTTASDVYSLGALLYRLLTGTMAHRFDDDSSPHIERVICEVTPVLPSEAVAGGDDRLRRTLAGDLDNIVLKALSKDPARRYASVDLLAQDLDHYLRGLPVAARADSAAYRARKFVGRHRMAVAAGLLTAVLLVTGAVVTIIQARRARISAERAQRISTLVKDMFKLAEPGRVQGGTITARELLDRGSERIAIELAGDADAQATMYGVIGGLYRNLALNEPAARMLERALALREQASGSESLQFSAALSELADLRGERGEYGAALEMYRRALTVRRHLSAPPTDIAASLEGTGRMLSLLGKDREADAPLSEALAIRRRYSSGHATELVETMHELALTRLRQGNAAAGEPLFREAVELARSLPTTSASLQVKGLVNLARLRLRFEQRPAEAEALYREALDVARRAYPSNHPDLALCLGELALALQQRGRPVDAEPLASESRQMYLHLYGPQHREVITASHRLARILAEVDKPVEAERLYREATSASLAALGTKHPVTLMAQGDLGAFLQTEGRFRESEQVREANLAAAKQAFGDNDVYVARALVGLGELHTQTGDYVRAEQELRQALAIRQQLHPAGHFRIAEVQASLGAALNALGRHSEAETLLAEAVSIFEKEGRGSAGRTSRQQLADARRSLQAARR